MLEIGLVHFVIVSVLLAAAGVATIVTNRNAIGILMGVELLLNAAGINFVAFNHFAHPTTTQTRHLADAEVAKLGDLVGAHPEKERETLMLWVVREQNADALSVTEAPPRAVADGAVAADAGVGPVWVRIEYPAVDGLVFSIFIIVLAAAEAAVALAIFLNFYNNFASIDVERAQELKG